MLKSTTSTILSYCSDLQFYSVQHACTFTLFYRACKANKKRSFPVEVSSVFSKAYYHEKNNHNQYKKMKSSVCPGWTRTCDVMCPLCLPGGEVSKTACQLLTFHLRAFELQPIKSCSISSSSINSFRTLSERLMQQTGQESGSSECKVYHVFLGFYCFSK